MISAELSGIVLIMAIFLCCLQTQLEPSLPKLNTARSNVYRTLDSGQCCSRGRARLRELPLACINTRKSASLVPLPHFLLPADSPPGACARAVPFSPSQGICTPSPSHANAALQYWQSQYAHIFGDSKYFAGQGWSPVSPNSTSLPSSWAPPLRAFLLAPDGFYASCS